MNLRGVYFAAKGFNSMSNSSSGGGGYFSGGSKRPSQQDYFFADCKDIITECVKMPTMAGKSISFDTKHKEVNPYTRKKQKTEEEHTIFFTDINSDGIKNGNISFDTSKYSVMGVIDGNKIFGLDATTGQLDIMKIEASFSFGPHGDYDYDYDIIEEPLDRWDVLGIETYTVNSAEDIKHKRSGIRNVPEKEHEFRGIIELANYMREKKADFEKSENEEQPEGMGL